MQEAVISGLRLLLNASGLTDRLFANDINLIYLCYCVKNILGIFLLTALTAALCSVPVADKANHKLELWLELYSAALSSSPSFTVIHPV